jgi:hypothetical protein
MLDRRTFLRHGLVGAGALALGPRLGGTVLPATQLAASTAAVSAPRIITRAEWGADESIRNGERFFHPLTKAVVHHTAIDEVDPAAQVRGIYRSHVQTNGWSDIGYQYLIDRSGRIYEGRWARDYLPTEPHSGEDLGGRIVEGAHAESHNRGTLGIALLGTYSSPTAAPTDAAMQSLAHLIAWKFGPRNIDPHGSSRYERTNGEVEHFPNICGHRDIVQTGCPGDGLYPRLPWLRTAVADLLSTGLVGYRILGADGSLWNYGATTTFAAANDIGDVRRNVRAGVPVRTAAGTTSGRGVWVSDTGGSIYAFGDAPFHGSLGGQRLNKPIVGMAATPSGGGYWLVASDGGIFCFGDARFHGSTGAIRLNQPIVGMAATPSGNGYWLVASDGGIFCFGDAPFHGSTGAIRLNQPIMSMSPTLDGGGYWLVARDGGVFTFGNAAFLGSAVGRPGFTGPATFMSPVPGRNGYWILDSAGAVHGFGDAPVFGGGVSTGSRPALALVPVVHS